MRKLLIAAAVAASVPFVALSNAPAAHATCDPGYVVGVPASDGRLPVKCVPRGNVPPGYVDGTGGNAQPVPGTGHGAGFKTGPDQDNQRAQQQFTNYMAAHGYPSDWSAVRGVSYLAKGEQVCTGLQAGQSEGQQIGRLEGIVSRAEASLVVTAAHQFLCPGT
jgi:hypothetical protein